MRAVGYKIGGKTLAAPSANGITPSANFRTYNRITKPLMKPFQTRTKMINVLAASSHWGGVKCFPSSKQINAKNPKHVAWITLITV